MPADHVDVPALPVLLPLGVALMAASWLVLRRRGRLTARRFGAASVAGWYAVAVLGATLLPLHLAWGPGAGPAELFRIIVVPLTTMRVDDFLLNIVMTLPLAAVLRIVLGIRGKGRVVLTGLMISAGIELIQAVLVLALHGNRWADVNDMISNTLGAWLGFLALRRALRVPPFRAFLESCMLIPSGTVRGIRRPGAPTRPSGRRRSGCPPSGPAAGRRGVRRG
jgi:glycopeptide antibiotics resistance protein